MPNAVTDTPRRHRLSVDAYHAMAEAGILGQDARVELINGEIIEVADHSLQYDRDTKLPLYARAGIPEAWLLDLASRILTRHCEPGPDGYRRGEAYTDRDRITLPTPFDSELDLSGLL